MVQQIITLCDVCYDEGQTSSAHQYHLTIGGGAWALELCDVHHKELVAPLADVAERLGEAVKGKGKAAKAEGKPKAPGVNRSTAEPCLVCGHHSPTTAALLMHLRVKHETNLEGIYGTTCPLCNKASATASGLGGHASRSHPEIIQAEGFASVPEAFRYAAEHGDPHGVVAACLARHDLTALPERVQR